MRLMLMKYKINMNEFFLGYSRVDPKSKGQLMQPELQQTCERQGSYIDHTPYWEISPVSQQAIFCYLCMGGGDLEVERKKAMRRHLW